MISTILHGFWVLNMNLRLQTKFYVGTEKNVKQRSFAKYKLFLNNIFIQNQSTLNFLQILIFFSVIIRHYAPKNMYIIGIIFLLKYMYIISES